ncbi:tRNA lysidine(34) synthetase TilS [bacterium]|nr:MAG: tRNA lysidine(34) synthetase TilS [bacterium]
MLHQLEKTLRRQALMPEHGTYIVAVSGGRDSVTLLDLLHRLQEKWDWQLIVAHLDHGQREASADDASFVGALADRYGYKYLLGVLPRTPQSEAVLRQARYNWLDEVRREAGADKIVTAHHRHDRLETTAWHAIRGADRVGLTSLGNRHDIVVRPLIGFGRGDLITYAALRDLQWREDATNNDRSYTRNLIRHELMHFAPTQDAHYHNNLSNWIDHLETINDRIEQKLGHLLAEIGDKIAGGYEIDRVKFLRLSPLVQLNLLSYMARQLTAGRRISQRNLDSALAWWASASSGSYSEALPGLLMAREYDRVKFVLRSATPEYSVSDKTQQLPFGKVLQFGKFNLVLQDGQVDDGTCLASHYLRPHTYYVRRWQSGDRIAPIGMRGTKKIQDIFVDRKVPRSERLTWPIVVTEKNEVALVPRLARSRHFAPAGVDAPAHTLAVKVA